MKAYVGLCYSEYIFFGFAVKVMINKIKKKKIKKYTVFMLLSKWL